MRMSVNKTTDHHTLWPIILAYLDVTGSKGGGGEEEEVQEKEND